MPAFLALLMFVPLFVFSGESAQTVQSLLSKAAALEKVQNYAEAENVYLRALNDYPGQPEILKRLGILYQTELKFHESIEVFQKALQESPDYPEVHLYIGLSMTTRKRSMPSNKS